MLSGTYRLLRFIGAGGMAEVYAAEHVRLGRLFAVKLLFAGRGQKALRRFHREAEAIARIENEFVVSIVDCGETDDGTPYLVMELLRGEDLRSLLDHAGPLPIPRAVSLILEACHGLAAVHRANLVHRDLKPENLFVARRSTGEDWCKILDFGIAKTDTSSTADGTVIGTVRYMAPEQLLDGTSVGASVDVYALGAVLYECLCGEPPYSGTSTQEVMFKIINEEPRPLPRMREQIPQGLADAIQRAMRKTPRERFADVGEFARALAPFSRPGGGPAETFSTERIEAAHSQPRPSRRIGLTPMLLGVTLLGIGGLGVRHLTRTHAQPITKTPVPLASSVMPDETRRALSVSPPVLAQAVVSAPVRPQASATGHIQARPSPPRSIAPAPRSRFDVENPYGQ